MKIGVLDDNPAILDYIETILTMDDHIVHRHSNGTSLLEALFSHISAHGTLPYDLLILDLLLPGKYTGADVFILIRKNFANEHIPMIVITAVSGSTLEQFKHILPDDVPLLRKPFSPRALRQLIAQYAAESSDT